MMVNKRLQVPAFTILEMVIAMLISAIVIGITYTSYRIINQSYQSFKHKNEAIAILSRLDQLLKRDFDHADWIGHDANSITLQQSGRPDISYEFGPDHIIRKGSRIDTFKVVNNHLQMLFEKQIKAIQDNINLSGAMSSEDRRIDEIIFDIEFQKEVVTFHYTKQYSSENLINRNPYAIN